MAKYTVKVPIPGYPTSVDAKNDTNEIKTVHPSTYYIYSEANGMINITSQEGVPGTWINPGSGGFTDVTSNSAPGASASSNKSYKASNPSYSSTTTPSLNSSGTNKRVYRPVKPYIPCYVINLITGGKIEFDCEPEEISDSNSNQFDPQDIRGRSSPFQGYSNSGPRTINFSVTLHDDLCKEGILNTVNHLKSLTYPGYGGVLTAPKCLIRIGDMIHCNAIINDVGVSWQKPYRNGVYVLAEVSISATEVVDTPYSASDIWSRGGFI